MKLTAPSRALLLGTAAAFALVAVWYQVFWIPQSLSIARARGREQTSSVALISVEQRLGHLKRLAAKSSVLDAASAKLVAAVPDHDDMDNFLLELNTDAQNTSVIVTGIGITQPIGTASSIATAQSPDGLTPISLQLSINGGYFDIQRFLALLRDGPRLVVIDSVVLSGGAAAAPSRAGGGSSLTITIVGRVFMIKGVTPPGANAPPTTVATHSGVLETPINAAKSAAAGASANAVASSGATP